MITEDYVGYGTAKLLKEKGFDWEVHRSYLVNDNVFIPGDINDVPLRKDAIRIPTLQMAMKWLREVHNYDISICLDSYVEPYDNEYYIVIRRRKVKFEEVSPCEQVYFKTYEQACEAAIKYCLENLI